MHKLIRPSLLLDSIKCRENISRAVDKARREKVVLRPHFKTHQSAVIGRWFREAGVDRITVSSVSMATYFAADGWKDITIAIPFNIHEAEEMNQLAGQLALHLFVTDPEPIALLGKMIRYPVGLFIEVDTGQHRSGVHPDDTERIEKILGQIRAFPHLRFEGFATHAGHSYSLSGDRERIRQVHRESLAMLDGLKTRYEAEYPGLLLSAGDTPTFSVAEGFAPLDEVRPGNFVFYDLMQVRIGSCTPDRIAVALACPVISVNPERAEAVIHGGAVHLSKEHLLRADGSVIFGAVTRLHDRGWESPGEEMYVKALSQEHGIIHLGNSREKLVPGDWVAVLPVHSCLAADLAGAYLSLEGDRIAAMRTAGV
ncbi:MAG: alanine racemase [Bacteroidota bacterium]